MCLSQFFSSSLKVLSLIHHCRCFAGKQTGDKSKCYFAVRLSCVVVMTIVMPASSVKTAGETSATGPAIIPPPPRPAEHTANRLSYLGACAVESRTQKSGSL